MIYWNDHASGRSDTSLKQERAYKFDKAIGETSLWGDDLRPNTLDIDQGDVQDCFMLASAASLSWVPERIKKIFLTDELNKEGIIAVRFFIGGKPTVVVIDDAVPWKNKQRLMFAQTSEDNGSWIPYLEKAYAKFAGNYEKTAKGWMSESMRILTGAPSHRFNMKKMGNEELWALMVSA